MTPQQERLKEAADELVAVIELHVPESTVHYAVEDARRAAATLARLADSVHTTDKGVNR